MTSKVAEMLADKIIALAKENERLISLRDGAKTNLKKDYYNKKIKKISEKAERLIRGMANLPSLNKQNDPALEVVPNE